MTSSIVFNESNVRIPEAIVGSDHNVVPHLTHNNESTVTTATVEYNIRENEDIEIYNGDELVYHFLEKSLHKLLNNDDDQQEFVLLYDKEKEPLWKLVNKDWHGMKLQYLKDDTIIILLSNMSPLFKFTLNQCEYHWQILPSNDQSLYSLACYSNTKLITKFKNNQLSILNPQHDFIQSSFLCLSGMLVNYHVKYLLKSLGNKPEVIQMMLHDNPTYTTKHQMSTTTTDWQLGQDEEDEIASLSSIITRNNNYYYPGHHNLVNNSNENRWSSSAQSFKSVELDPGFWHCYWGYTFWWSWFPCCMPGGCFDRGCIKLKGAFKFNKNASRTLSKQGYQQHRY